MGRIRLVRVVSRMFHHFKVHIYVGVGGHGVLSNVTRVVNRTSGVISVAITVSGLSGVNLSGMGSRLHSGRLSRNTVTHLRPVVVLGNAGHRGLTILGGRLTTSRVTVGNVTRVRFVLSHVRGLRLATSLRLSLALTHNLGCCANTVFRIGTLSIRVKDVAKNKHCSGLANIFNVSNVSNIKVSFNTSHVFSILGRLRLCPISSLGAARLLFIGFNRGRRGCLLPLVSGIHTTNVHARLCPRSTGVGGRVKCTSAGGVPFITVINRGRVGRNGVGLGGVLANRRSLIALRRLVREF